MSMSTSMLVSGQRVEASPIAIVYLAGWKQVMSEGAIAVRSGIGWR